MSEGSNKVNEDIFYIKEMVITPEKFKEIDEAASTFWQKGKLKINPRINHQEEKKRRIEAVKEKIDKDGVSKENIKELINNLL